MGRYFLKLFTSIYKIFPNRSSQDFNSIPSFQELASTREAVDIERQSQRANVIVVFREDRQYLCLNYKQWCMLSLIFIGIGFALGFVIMFNETNNKNLHL